jgi:hypothetical protein
LNQPPAAYQAAVLTGALPDQIVFANQSGWPDSNRRLRVPETRGIAATLHPDIKVQNSKFKVQGWNIHLPPASMTLDGELGTLESRISGLGGARILLSCSSGRRYAVSATSPTKKANEKTRCRVRHRVMVIRWESTLVTSAASARAEYSPDNRQSGRRSGCDRSDVCAG